MAAIPEGWKRYGTGIIRSTDNAMIDKHQGQYQAYRYVGGGRHERVGPKVATLAEAMALLC